MERRGNAESSGVDWIEEKKAELEEQRRKMVADISAITGALQLLDMMKKEGLDVRHTKDRA